MLRCRAHRGLPDRAVSQAPLESDWAQMAGRARGLEGSRVVVHWDRVR